MSNMVSVTIKNIRDSPMSQQRVILLRVLLDEVGLIPEEDISVVGLAIEEDAATERLSTIAGHLESL